MRIREVRREDFEPLHVLNQSEVPHVGTLSRQDFDRLMLSAYRVRVVADPEKEVPHGYLIAFREDSSYGSPNFKWFQARYPSFVYVDRIVVGPRLRGQGWGRKLYEDVMGLVRGSTGLVTCEVNLLPPNPESMAFHQKLGFTQVGKLDSDGGKKSLAMLALQIPSS